MRGSEHAAEPVAVTATLTTVIESFATQSAPGINATLCSP